MDMLAKFDRVEPGLRFAASAEIRPELADPQARVKLVGLGFRVVQEVFLMEIGDEFLDVDGHFRSVPLDCVGRCAPAGVLVRRLERRAR